MSTSYTGTKQPIIRGIQAVGAVELRYRYNNRYLTLPKDLMYIHGGALSIDTDPKGSGRGIRCAGFRLDSEFLRASPQIASSFMIPILGGGAVALTNNNRSGTLSIRTTKVSTPSWATGSSTEQLYYDKANEDGTSTKVPYTEVTLYQGSPGAMLTGNGIGVSDNQSDADSEDIVFDITTLLQSQQAQEGGDDVGATIYLAYKFNGLVTALQFEGCTVASIDPVALSGNDAVDYNATINYLNWRSNMSDDSSDPFSAMKIAAGITSDNS